MWQSAEFRGSSWVGMPGTVRSEAQAETLCGRETAEFLGSSRMGRAGDREV